MKTIYFDQAATTFPKPDIVYEKMDDANRHLGVNAGRGSYQLARKATELIDQTREALLNLANAQGSDVIFTPSVTVALNEILQGLPWEEHSYVYVSPFEHNAVMRTLEIVKKRHKIEVLELPIKINGTSVMIDCDKMEYLFSQKKPGCVCCTHVSNVTGYILPIKEIFYQAKKYDSITVLDASQSLGLLDVDAEKMKADYIAFAGHKTLYGPFGIGGFIQCTSLVLEPYIAGGTGTDSLNLNMPYDVPTRYEPASTNIVAVAGLLAAINYIEEHQHILDREQVLTEYLISELETIDGITLYLPEKEEEHIGIVSFRLDGYQAADVGQILDLDYGIAVRTGYHCSPLIHQYLGDIECGGTVRASVGNFTTIDEIDQLVKALVEIVDE